MERFYKPSVWRQPLGDGFVVRGESLSRYRRCVTDWLDDYKNENRVALCERSGDGWKQISYFGALRTARAIGQALLDLGLSARRPLVVLSGNSLAHAQLMLGALFAGVPIAPLSPAYSLMSADHAKLRAIVALVEPGAIFVESKPPFEQALAALAPTVPVLDAGAVNSMRFTDPTTVRDANDALSGDSVAKILFTSGSTGTPKGVINTHRMLCSNQAALAIGWPFLREQPPTIVDWLPWSHTFGANHNFNLVLANGGTLYIDGGKPAPGAFDETLRNLREVSPTIYFNVPRGFDMLVPHLETDQALRARFFAHLQTMFYAAAALSPATWKRLAALGDVAMTSAWGSTETSPLVTQVCFPIDRAGVIGLPVAGVELAFVPNGDKLEMRVKGPCLSPGYLGPGGAIEPLPLDEHGFYPMGDAGRFSDDGVVFEGRTSENFKLVSGTWVHVGELRIALIAALAPHVADAVIAGHDRDELGALVFLAPGARIEDLRDAFARQAGGSSSTRIARLVVLAEPPSIDAGEITDKGYLNQRAILARRADAVARLYSAPDVHV